MHGLCGSSLVVVSVLVAAVASLHAPEDEWHEAIELMQTRDAVEAMMAPARIRPEFR